MMVLIVGLYHFVMRFVCLLALLIVRDSRDSLPSNIPCPQGLRNVLYQQSIEHDVLYPAG